MEPDKVELEAAESATQSCPPCPRRQVRSLILHLLYAADAFEYEASIEGLADQFNRGFDTDIPREGEVVTTVKAIVENRKKYDEFLIPLLSNWRLERIGCCTRLVLHLALWELMETDTPATIILNEAIELAKCFSEKDAYKFVNGVLDKAVRQLGRDVQ